MDERRRKITFNGKETDALEMPFTTGAEFWNEYVLHDGSVLRLKSVVTEILKLEDQFDAEGNPVYLLKSTNIVSISPSDRSRKPKV
jgi:hypothetical protein